MKGLYKYDKNVRLVLYKVLNKNIKKYKYYLKNERFECIEDIESMEQLGYKALKQNKAPVYHNGLNLKFFDCKYIADEMLKDGWVMLKDVFHEYQYSIAIKLKPPKKFSVEIIEVLSKVVEIETENNSRALDTVRRMYRNCEIVLDSSDYKGTEYKIV